MLELAYVRAADPVVLFYIYVEIKPIDEYNRECCVLRASMMYAFGRAYGLPYKMASFHSKKGLSIRSGFSAISKKCDHMYVSVHASSSFLLYKSALIRF